MEEIKFSKLVSKFEFVKDGMIKGEKSLDNFIRLHRLYDTNKNKSIKLSSTKMIFDNSEFSIAVKSQKNENKLNKMKMIIISAIGMNNEIGYKDSNDLIWKIKNDMRHFKEVTTNHFILMGRKTFDSFKGRLLPNRIHVVISNSINIDYSNNHANVFCFKNIDSAIKWINDSKECFEINQEKFYIIGGGEIYRQTIELADELDLTCIEDTVLNINTTEEQKHNIVFFPEIDMNQFYISSNEKHINDDNILNYNFRKLTKRKLANNKINHQVLNNKIINKLLINYVNKHE